MKKLFLSVFAILMGLTVVTGCEHKETKKSLLCSPIDAYNENNSMRFDLAEDGKTVTKIVYQEGFTEAFIDKWYPDDNKDEMYELGAERVKYIYAMMMSGNEDLEWIDGQVYLDKEHYTGYVVLAFDVAHEDFEANTDNLAYLGQLGLNFFYNEDEKRFEVDGDKIEAESADTWLRYNCELQDQPTK